MDIDVHQVGATGDGGHKNVSDVEANFKRLPELMRMMVVDGATTGVE